MEGLCFFYMDMDLEVVELEVVAHLLSSSIDVEEPVMLPSLSP